jgi:hypothetical protein
MEKFMSYHLTLYETVLDSFLLIGSILLKKNAPVTGGGFLPSGVLAGWAVIHTKIVGSY